MGARGVALIILIFIVIRGFGQEWHKGTVILRNQSFLAGELSIEPETGDLLVRIDDGDAMMVLPPFRIESFIISDKNSGARKFVSLPVNLGAARFFTFFEVMAEGEVSVLRKQKNEWYSFRTEADEFEYFFLTESRFLTLREFRKKLFPVLKNESPSVKEFVQKNRISPFLVKDNIRFVQFYNAERSATASVR